jgi:hypothetical protein
LPNGVVQIVNGQVTVGVDDEGGTSQAFGVSPNGEVADIDDANEIEVAVELRRPGVVERDAKIGAEVQVACCRKLDPRVMKVSPARRARRPVDEREAEEAAFAGADRA